MKIVVPQKQLKEAIMKVSRGLNIKTMPVLKGIKISADEQIKLRATDLEIDIESVINGEIEEKGEIVVLGSLFKKYISKAPKDKIEISSEDGNKIKIKANGSNTQISGLNVDNFPENPDFEEKKSIKLQEGKLKEILNKSEFATSKDDNKVFLTGVLFEHQKSKFTVVGTDTYKMSVVQSDTTLDEDFKVIIPNVTVSTLSSILNETEEEITIYFSDKMIKFDLKHTIINSRIIEGKYPNYGQVIPKKQPHKVKLNRKSLLDAIERTLILADDNVIYFDINKDYCKLSSPDGGQGKSLEQLDHAFKGNELQLSINGSYLLNFLKTSNAEEVVLEGRGTLKPLKFKEKDNNNWVGVIMPIRTQ